MILSSLISLCLSAGMRQDSLPPLHTIPDKIIANVKTSDKDESITVTMKNGSIYKYDLEDWDLEDTFKTISPRLKEAIENAMITFAKTAQPPEYPGGEAGWNSYLKEFCSKHKNEIKYNGPATIKVQFVVHYNGQVLNLKIIGEPGMNKLEKLALRAVAESGPWKPGIENGRKVIAYRFLSVNLSN